jgi:sugar diacid utilization regulator
VPFVFETVQPLPPLSPKLRDRIERAYRDRGRMVRTIIALCRKRFPHYAALTGEALESFCRNADMVTGAFYRLQLLEGREPSMEDLEPQREAARLRFAQGVPLPEMIGCYQSGLPTLWADLVASVQNDAEVQGELLFRVPVTISANTLVTTIVTEAYVEERERCLRTRGEAVDELLRLFAGEDAALGVLDSRARALGVGLGQPRTAVLFRPAVDSETHSGSAVDEVRRFFEDLQVSSEIVLGRVEEGVLALLPEDADPLALADMAGKLRGRGWRTGVGSSGVDASGLRRSIREAVRAIEIAEMLGHEGPLDRYVDLAVLDLVDVGSPRALEFARRVLGTLVDASKHRTHLQTLRALCRSGFRHKLAAAELNVHPHTLSYRLSQIRRRFGLDLEDAETRLRVHLSLLILDV